MKIITGWSRGGLGYVAELLRLHGHSVGQSVFLPDATAEQIEAAIPGAEEFQVSPFAVPHLGLSCLSQHQVYFVLRDPMRVLNSLYFLGKFSLESRNEIRELAFDSIPGLRKHYNGKPAQAAVAYIAKWLEMANLLGQGRITFVKLEAGPAVMLQQLASDTRKELLYCSTEINKSGCQQSLVPSRLPEAAKNTMLFLLHRLGYKNRVWFPRGGHAHYVNPDWHC